MNFRNDIEGLRGLSVIYVLLYHYFPKLFNGGIFGVDFFFVISGFVITSSLKNRNNSVFFFYQKRVNRIYPAAYACLLWITVGKHFVVTINLLKDICYAIIFIVNFRFYFSSVDYFGNKTSIILHYWSLSIENQFYIFYPMFINIFKEKVFILLIMGFFLSFYHLLINYKKYPEYCYFVTFTRIWEIVAGCILYHITSVYSKINETVKKLVHLTSTFSILMVLFIGDKLFIIPGPFTFIPILISSFICIDSKNRNFSFILTNYIIRSLGTISYSLYLYHYPIRYFKMKLYNRIIVTFTLAIISYKLIEKPFQIIKIRLSIYFLLFLGIITSIIYLIKCRIKMIKKITHNIKTSSKYNECLWIDIKVEYKIDYNSVKYLFLGDSHLQMYYPLLQFLFRETTLHFYYFFFNIYYQDIKILENMIKPLKNIEKVVVSFLLHLDIFNKTLEEENRYLEMYFKMLQNYAKEVIFIQDIPFLHFDPIEEFRKGKHFFAIGVNASRVIINLKNKRIVILNPFDLFCHNNLCNYMYNNISIYKDNHHLEDIITKDILRDYFSKHLNIPLKCNNRSILYKCDLRLERYLTKFERKFAKEHNIKVLKRIIPKPEL